MAYTMEDFKRDYVWERFAKLEPEKRLEILLSLPREERREITASLVEAERREDALEKLLESLPLETRLKGLSAEQIQEYLDRLTAEARTELRKPRRRRSQQRHQR